jgi:hypothetical protein
MLPFDRFDATRRNACYGQHIEKGEPPKQFGRFFPSIDK